MRRPPNDHEKADAMFISILDTFSRYVEANKRKGKGGVLVGVLLALHTQAIAFRDRPELAEPLLDMIEAFMISVNMTTEATHTRETSEAMVARKWAEIDAMDMSTVDDKSDA